MHTKRRAACSKMKTHAADRGDCPAGFLRTITLPFYHQSGACQLKSRHQNPHIFRFVAKPTYRQVQSANRAGDSELGRSQSADGGQRNRDGRNGDRQELSRHFLARLAQRGVRTYIPERRHESRCYTDKPFVTHVCARCRGQRRVGRATLTGNTAPLGQPRRLGVAPEPETKNERSSPVRMIRWPGISGEWHIPTKRTKSVRTCFRPNCGCSRIPKLRSP